MHLRRLISVLSVAVVATGVVASGVVGAQPKKADKKADKKKKPDPAAGSAGSAGSAAAGSAAGSAVAPIEDAPPSDIEGRDENPDAPKVGGGDTDEPTGPVAPVKPTGYPIEEVLRPITLHAGMFEASLFLHTQIPDFENSDALRVRYGITNQIEVGLTYVFLGIWDRQFVDNGLSSKTVVNPGKAVGLDVTYRIFDWGGVRLGFPLYVDPFAMSLTVGVPLKFRFGDKVAIGALDDFLNFRIYRFPISYYSERVNAVSAQAEINNTAQSRGSLTLSGYGQYQLQPNLALMGRLGLEMRDFSANRGETGRGGWFTSLRAGAQFSVMPNLDVGGMLGFDDLSTTDSFTINVFGAFRL